MRSERGSVAGRGRGFKVLVVVSCAAVLGVLGYQVLADPGPSLPRGPVVSGERLTTPPGAHLRGARPRAPGKAHLPRLADARDGVLPPGTTVFDSGVPALDELDSVLLAALRQAAADAAVDGVTFYVDSGWRSLRYQRQLFRDAVAKYGSAAEAARWVAPPGTSAHERGEAVDLGHEDAVSWLAERGAAYGLCQIYGNESWHYELRPDTAGDGCPAQYPDATYDPRTQQ